MTNIQNDNDVAQPAHVGPGPDANGQAAILLIESLLHGLIERSVITVADAVSFVEAACDVREEIGHELSEAPDSMAKSLTTLRSIASSLRFDLKEPPLKIVE